MSNLEIAANAVMSLSIWLAARNTVHTWSTGVLGSLLFCVLFYQVQLYADATLQLFFIATSVAGWWQWRHVGGSAKNRPVSRASTRSLAVMAIAAIVVTVAYGALLHRFTDAYMPFVDAGVLSLSVVAQLLLMQRKVQTWYWWIAVNTLSVPLFASRGLWLTSALYSVYWFNAWYGLWRWRREVQSPQLAENEGTKGGEVRT